MGAGARPCRSLHKDELVSLGSRLQIGFVPASLRLSHPSCVALEDLTPDWGPPADEKQGG